MLHSTLGSVATDSTLGITNTCRKHAAMFTDAKNLPTRTARSESRGIPKEKRKGFRPNLSIKI